jgi:hypothetical protein
LFGLISGTDAISINIGSSVSDLGCITAGIRIILTAAIKKAVTTPLDYCTNYAHRAFAAATASFLIGFDICEREIIPRGCQHLHKRISARLDRQLGSCYSNRQTLKRI